VACTPGHLGQFCDLDAGPQFACCPGAGCVDTSADPLNCGSCGQVCYPGLSCVAGACVALACTAGLQTAPCVDDAGVSGNCCASTCVHRGSDPTNCGACGHACDAGMSCTQGLCG
jgi:hypothetical protein